MTYLKFVTLDSVANSIKNYKLIVSDVALHIPCLHKYTFIRKTRIPHIQKKQTSSVSLLSFINSCTTFTPSTMRNFTSKISQEFSNKKLIKCPNDSQKNMVTMFSGLIILLKEAWKMCRKESLGRMWWKFLGKGSISK